MDLALAYHLRGKLEEAGHELDAWQFQALVHATREAKEKLLGDDALAETPVAVPSRGSSLFAKTLATTLARDEVVAILIDGYFPRHRRQRLAGAAQIGRAAGVRPRLCDRARRQPAPRAVPAARARERALRRRARGPGRRAAAAAAPVELLRPTAVLFNGGVFEAPSFRARVVELLRVLVRRRRTAEGAEERGARHRRVPRRRLLRRGARVGQGHHDPGRHVALVLPRAREPDAGGAGLRAAGQGHLRRAAGHEGRHRARTAGPRVRPRHRRSGGVPFLRFRRSAPAIASAPSSPSAREDARRAAGPLGHAAAAGGRRGTGRAR